MRLRVPRGKGPKILLALILSGVLVPALIWGQSGYFLFYPGQVADTRDMVTIPDGRPGEGKVLMTTVRATQATYGLLLYGALNPRIGVYHRRQVIPRGMDMDQYSEFAREMMKESQAVAIMLALRELDKEVSYTGQGVQLVQVVPGGSWSVFGRGDIEHFPEPGDVIVAVGDSPVGTLETLTARLIQAHQEKRDRVTLLVRRNAIEVEVELPLFLFPLNALEEGEWVRRIGVLLETLEPVMEPSLAITIDAGEIGGPSAGLMFFLEIIDQLIDGDITVGRTVAGTGALSETGEVLPVGGVRQKVLAAEGAGAEIFFVPRWQLADALRAADKMSVVPVNKVQDAMAHLASN